MIDDSDVYQKTKKGYLKAKDMINDLLENTDIS